MVIFFENAIKVIEENACGALVRVGELLVVLVWVVCVNGEGGGELVVLFAWRSGGINVVEVVDVLEESEGFLVFGFLFFLPCA